MEFKSKYNTGDKVKARHRGSEVETKIVGITASEVIEGKDDIKRNTSFYTLECNRDAKYSEADLLPVTVAQEKNTSKKPELVPPAEGDKQPK